MLFKKLQSIEAFVECYSVSKSQLQLQIFVLNSPSWLVILLAQTTHCVPAKTRSNSARDVACFQTCATRSVEYSLLRRISPHRYHRYNARNKALRETEDPRHKLPSVQRHRT